MASEKASSHRQIPLDEIQQHRGVAQQQSMNAILSAQHRYNDSAATDSARDAVYDAIADAKRQISEKDKIPFKGTVGDRPQGNTTERDARVEKQEDRKDSTTTSVVSSIRETLTDYG
ncbi:hypothetical protein GOP47_0029912 [Adiantum capillus-veneris]|nr:hypothetical protein GOP47_0029912 [Adiantum capillus-veneris]